LKLGTSRRKFDEAQNCRLRSRAQIWWCWLAAAAPCQWHAAAALAA
jgi:hypothetical protein